MKWKCCDCGTENDFSYKCVECGALNTVDFICSECGSINDVDATCPQCGHELCDYCETLEDSLNLNELDYDYESVSIEEPV